MIVRQAKLVNPSPMIAASSDAANHPGPIRCERVDHRLPLAGDGEHEQRQRGEGDGDAGRPG